MEGRGFVGLLSKHCDPKTYEEKIIKWYEEEKIYHEVKRASTGGLKFYFLDGPPYVTNPIHVGTAWNKLIKDVFLRYYRMKGYEVRDQPGYDMHGLPIEVMVERKLNLRSKREIEEKFGIGNFIRECRSYALENLKVLERQFKNLVVWMDWDRPYRTIDNDYIECVWLSIKKAHEKGLLWRGSKVVHWCFRCGTVLSGYEVTEEYREVASPSVYVKFPIEGKDNEYMVIWTTTPWTLPSNVAVMVHPEYMYTKVRVGDEVYILAEARLKEVFKEVGLSYEVLETFQGKELEGLRYLPPLLKEVPKQQKISPAHIVILSSEYVTLSEGTGCVHVAPGHGEEDLEIGLKYGLPVLSPVDDKGVFTEEAGKYVGKLVLEASEEIIEDLKGRRLLLHVGKVVHRYPHCWRCKSPLILRSSTQWFIKVTSIKDRLIEEIEKVNWVPEWAGKVRFRKWLEEAKDWVISRQRYWGIPLPIWICERCSLFKVIGSVKELREEAAEPLPEPLDLHRPLIDEATLRCSCGGLMKRVPDVLDVWMDSGAASWACLNYPLRDDELRKWWPTDLVLEGHDQTRGWFYTLLVMSMIVFDKAPYLNVLVHGFSLDEQGRAMHKSLGNIVYPEEVIEKYGRDTLRWYELSCTTWEDLNFSWKGVEEAYRDLNVQWNTFYFASLYMNLDKFNPFMLSEEAKKQLAPEDKWLLSKIQSLIKQVSSAIEGLAIHEALRALSSFILDNVSRWYIRLIRRKTWIDKSDPAKISTYYALYQALFTYLKMAAIFTPLLAEQIYQQMFRPISTTMPKSIHLCRWPQPEELLVDRDLEEVMEAARDIVNASFSARQAASIKLRRPLSKAFIVSSEPKVKKCLETLRHILLDQMNVKDVELMEQYKEELKEGLVKAEFKEGILYIDVKITEETAKESLAREVVRRLQEMRKQLDLPVDAYVDAYIIVPSETSLSKLKEMENYLRQEVRIKQLNISMAKRVPEKEFYTKLWTIDDEDYEMGIKLV